MRRHLLVGRRRLTTNDVSASFLGASLLSELPWRDRDDALFKQLVTEAESFMEGDGEMLSGLIRSTILSSSSFLECVGRIVSRKMARDIADTRVPLAQMEEMMVDGLAEDDRVGADVLGTMSRDPAAISYLQCCLFFKGFHAVQAQRCASKLWRRGDAEGTHSALCVQDRVLELWNVDAHPGAELGGGLMMDHATSVVIGETAVVGEDCTMLHGCTLGGVGKARACRHPKIGDRVTLGAGATIIGNITVGDDATIGSQAVVTRDVPPGLTVVGQNKLLNPFISPSRKEHVKRRQDTWLYETMSEA